MKTLLSFCLIAVMFGLSAPAHAQNLRVPKIKKHPKSSQRNEETAPVNKPIVVAPFIPEPPSARTLSIRSTVKISSGLCGQDENRFRGSGVLTPFQGKWYVLTSNHVVLNGNGNFCHHVTGSTIGTLSANLIASDWSAGLALLEVENKGYRLNSVGSLQLRTSEAQNNEPMTASGFPFEGNEIIQSTRGYVLQAASTRHWLGNTVPMIELMDAHAEFGMSGGPVFSADATQIVGILSHQALDMVSGRPTQILDMSSTSASGRVFNHIFVIPSQFVFSWMSGILNGSIKPSLVEVASEQILGNHLVISGGLSFSITSAGTAGIGGGNGSGVGGGNGSGIGGDCAKIGGGNGTGIGGGNGTGIGGGNGTGIGGGNGTGIGGGNGTGIGGGNGTGIGGGICAGIGGGNGTGIGGDGNSSTSPDDRVIEVKLAPLGYQTDSLYESTNWYNETKKALLLNHKVYIPFLVKRDANSLAPVRVKISSLDQFFRYLADPTMIPLPTSVDDKIKNLPVNATVSAASGPLLHNSIVYNNHLIALGYKLEEKQLLSRVKVSLDILSSVEWQNITPKDLKQLSDGHGVYAEAWAQLFDPDDHAKFDDAVKLMRSLQDLGESLKSTR